MYHAIVIEESLKDKSVLDKYRILATKVSSRWHLHIIELQDSELFISDLQSALVSDQPYYFHVYDNDRYLKVVFKDKVFMLDSQDKSTWLEAQNYGGEILNIPAQELDFSPNRFDDEADWLN